MLSTALAITSAATGALGAYNAGRFFLGKAREKRLELKQRNRDRETFRAAVKYARGAYSALSDGLDDAERAKIQAIAAAVKAEIAGSKKGPTSAA